jgi:hydrogenase nickel incorporation protein HypA/HybF
MHEMSLAEGIIQLLEDQAKAQDFSRVKQVWLSIGELAGVEVEALDFAWKWSAATRWPPARFHFVRQPGEGWCLACSQQVAVHARFDACPQCGKHQVQVTGDEMRVSELEVE